MYGGGEPLSRGDARAALLAGLTREFRRLNGAGATYLRAVAGRVGMNAADVQVIDSLAVGGPLTAGQLTALTGLTTGAIAQLLDRLEGAGLVRRERDPDDGRRVIVRLAADGAAREVGAALADGARAWEALAAGYDDDQLALIVAFLERANALAEAEAVRLREGPTKDAGDAVAPLGDLGSGRLVLASGAVRLVLRADAAPGELYRARFAGAAPSVTVAGGTVTIRYPRRLWHFGRDKQVVAIALNATIPWQIAIRGGAADVVAELGGLALAGLEIAGGASQVRLDLPEPSGTVRIRIDTGVSDVVVRRPAGVAARVRVKGWASMITFDDLASSDMGSGMRLESPGYADAPHRYDIEITGSASQFTLTTT